MINRKVNINSYRYPLSFKRRLIAFFYDTNCEEVINISNGESTVIKLCMFTKNTRQETEGITINEDTTGIHLVSFK